MTMSLVSWNVEWVTSRSQWVFLLTAALLVLSSSACGNSGSQPERRIVVPTTIPATVPTLPPKPTQTISQKETVIAQRSAEVFAKQTATALQTLSPAPQSTVTPLPPTSDPSGPGLGVSREAFVSYYEDELEFDCYDWLTPTGDTNAWICEAPIDYIRALNATVHLSGDPDDIMEAQTFVTNPRQNLEAAALHMKVFLGIAVPEWDDSLEWMTDNIASAMDGNTPSTTRGTALVTMEWFGLGSEELSIRVEAR